MVRRPQGVSGSVAMAMRWDSHGVQPGISTLLPLFRDSPCSPNSPSLFRLSPFLSIPIPSYHLSCSTFPRSTSFPSTISVPPAVLTSGSSSSLPSCNPKPLGSPPSNPIPIPIPILPSPRRLAAPRRAAPRHSHSVAVPAPATLLPILLPTLVRRSSIMCLSPYR